MAVLQQPLATHGVLLLVAVFAATFLKEGVLKKLFLIFLLSSLSFSVSQAAQVSLNEAHEIINSLIFSDNCQLIQNELRENDHQSSLIVMIENVQTGERLGTFFDYVLFSETTGSSTKLFAQFNLLGDFTEPGLSEYFEIQYDQITLKVFQVTYWKTVGPGSMVFSNQSSVCR